MAMLHFRPGMISPSVRTEVEPAVRTLITDAVDRGNPAWDVIPYHLKHHLLREGVVYVQTPDRLVRVVSDVYSRPFFTIVTENWTASKPQILAHLESEWARLALPGDFRDYGMDRRAAWTRAQAYSYPEWYRQAFVKLEAQRYSVLALRNFRAHVRATSFLNTNTLS